jgi:hypothetical protein
MQVITYKLPAYWASALINNDWSGYDKEEREEIKNWLNINGNPNIVSVGESFVGRFGGLIYELAEYQALCD